MYVQLLYGAKTWYIKEVKILLGMNKEKTVTDNYMV